MSRLTREAGRHGVDEFVCAPQDFAPSTWARITDRHARERACIRAICERTVAMWPDARMAALWDGDVCLFGAGGVVVTDLFEHPGQDDGVWCVPISAIERVYRTQRADPSLKVADLDSGQTARHAGFIAGLGSGLVAPGAGFGGAMMGAVVVNHFMRQSSGPVIWDCVEIRTSEPRVGTLRLDFCQDADGAYAVEQTIAAALQGRRSRWRPS